MIVLREIRKRCSAVVWPVLGFAVTLYFFYSLIEGNRGLLAWVHTRQEIAATKVALAVTHKEEAALQRKDYELTPSHLDRDLLDERVRAVLGFIRPDEIVIPEKPQH